MTIHDTHPHAESPTQTATPSFQAALDRLSGQREADKTWVLKAMSEHAKFMREAKKATRVSGP